MSTMEAVKRIRQLRKTLSPADSLVEMKNTIVNSDDPFLYNKCGLLLEKYTLETWESALGQSVQSEKIAIVSNFTCNEVQNFLRADLLKSDIYSSYHIGDYNQYFYEMMDKGSDLHSFSADLTLCLLDEHVVFDDMESNWLIDDVAPVLEAKIAELTGLFSKYAKDTEGTLVLNTIPMSSLSYDSLVDYRSKMRINVLWRKFNTQLLSLGLGTKNIVVIDSEIFLQSEVVTNLFDSRMAAYAKMYMSEGMLAMMAKEIAKIVRALKGKTKKCLVMDLDNTLWGGIIGDDGVNGIELGGTPHGEAFTRFQKTVKKMGRQGVLLTLNSKNDRENTDQVFSEHPDAALCADDFVKQCVNWNPKNENIIELTNSLNINTNSVVFFDDSSFECNLVRETLPEVAVVELDDNPCDFSHRLLSEGWFNSMDLTQEDVGRVKKYKTDEKRKEFLSSHNSIEEYLHKLKIEVGMFSVDEYSVSRIAQLTQRTNQFNMTTWRLSESQVIEINNAKNWKILSIRASDRFGDNGVVGCIFLESDPVSQEYFIRNFILSCRVFSRGIEISCLQKLLTKIKSTGGTAVFGEYISSSRNGKVSDFYLNNGFFPVESANTESEKVIYKHTLDIIEDNVNWISIETDNS